MSESRFALLKDLPAASSSEERRALLRRATEALSQPAHAVTDAEFGELDELLSEVAEEYSLAVRIEFARLVAASVGRFCGTASRFALDEIEVAAPVLRQSQLPDETLLKVVREKSQAHMMAVTKRAVLSPALSHALVERGDDAVVGSLLENKGAAIAEATFDMVAKRAETAPALHGPLVGRQDVPLDLLHGLYQKCETALRREIMDKFQSVDPGELEKAFQRSRSRITENYASVPGDMSASRKRLANLHAMGPVKPQILPGILREGPSARTLFKLALAELVDVDFGVVDRAVEACDLDTLALLCRGARFDRALFVTLAVGLDQTAQGLSAAEQFGALYESVPAEAAQRALRFWKVRAA